MIKKGIKAVVVVVAGLLWVTVGAFVFTYTEIMTGEYVCAK